MLKQLNFAPCLMTTVGKITNKPLKPNQVYCGRAGRGQSGFWGNPEPLLNEEDRLACIERFHHRLWQGDLQYRLGHLEDLRHKELLCFCGLKACHCDVYADACNQLWPEDTKETDFAL